MIDKIKLKLCVKVHNANKDPIEINTIKDIAIINKIIILAANSILYCVKCEHLSQVSLKVDVRKGTLQYLQSAHSGFRMYSDFIELSSLSKSPIHCFYRCR